MARRAPKSTTLSRGLRSALLGLDAERRTELDRLHRADRPARGRNDLLLDLELVHRDPRQLQAPKRNVRTVKASHVKEVANAISELGFSVPVLIEPDGTIIDGVTRVEAATSLGLPTVPCIVSAARTEEEKRLLRLAVNRLGEKGAWDVETLKVELQELVIDDAPIEVTGFESFEIDGLLLGSPPAVERGKVDSSDEDAISRPGDVFRLGRHRVVCGDARDPITLSRLMNGGTARFVFTDEPYNVPIAGHVTKGPHREFAMASGEMSPAEFLAFNDAWIALAASHLIDGGLLGTYIDWRGLPTVTAAALAAGLEQINLVVWSKSNAGMGSLYRSQHELLPLFKKGAATPLNNVEMGKKGRWRSNVWHYPGASTVGSDSRKGLKQHPTVKPVAMLTDAILDLTLPGEIVLDPFLGSGSTLIAAELSERICHGVEFDPRYVDVILRRFHEVTGQDGRLEETGETFTELVERRHPREPDQAVSATGEHLAQIAIPLAVKGRARPARYQAAPSA